MCEKLSSFDGKVDNVLFDITASTASLAEQQRVKRIRRLPQELGGLGMMSYAGRQGDLGHILSRIWCRKFIKDKFPDLDLHASRHWDLTGLELALNEGAMVDSEANARRLRAGEDQRVFGDLVEALEDGDTKSLAMLNSGRARHSARWLKWHGTYSHTRIFSSTFFREALRTRCLLPFTSTDPVDVGPTLCICNAQVNLTDEWYHCMDCSRTKGLQSLRHHRVRDAFASFIKASGGHCGVEIAVQDTIQDIVIQDGPVNRYCDIGIVDASAPTYRQDAATTPGAASKEMEKAKRSYARRKLGAQLASASFTPLVIEATGKFGPAALKFARQVAGKRFQLLSTLFNEVSSACAYYNALMVEKIRHAIRQRQNGDPIIPLPHNNNPQDTPRA